MHPYMCICARGRICVSVCYVILSRPQLLSHTQQAGWRVQPTGPLLLVSVFLHLLYLQSLILPSFFLLSSYRISAVWIFISAGLLCKLRTCAYPPPLHHTPLSSVVAQWLPGNDAPQVTFFFFLLCRAAAPRINEFRCLSISCQGRKLK